MSVWLEKIHKAEERLSQASLYLGGLAYSFKVCGNEKMSINLISLQNDIDVSNREIHSGVGECLDQMLKGAEASSQNVLASVLAGVELGKKKKREK